METTKRWWASIIIDSKTPSGAPPSWEREGWSSRLEQQAKDKRVKPLVTYCSGKSKHLKPENAQTPPVPFFPWNGALVKGWMGQHRCHHRGHLSVDRATNQRLWVFNGPWVREQRGEVLGMEYWALRQSGEQGLRVSLFSQ